MKEFFNKYRKQLLIGGSAILVILVGLVFGNLIQNRLGFSVVSSYQSTVRVSMNATQDTVPVSSLTLKDDTTLDMSKLGSVAFLTLEPGKSKEEIVMCTGITTSTLTFTGCTRGLAFSGTSTISVAGNRETHNAGAIVTLSNVHYVYEQLTDKDSDEDIAGIKRFVSSTLKLGNQTSSTNKIIYADNGSGNLPFLRYNESLGKWQWTEDGVNTYNFTSSSVSTLTAGTDISIVGGAINVSSTATTSQPLYLIKAKTDGKIDSSWGGVALSLATLNSGGLVVENPASASTTSVAAGIPIANSSGKLSSWLTRYGDGSDGVLSVDSGTTTIDLGGQPFVTKNYTSVAITGTGEVNFTNAHASGTIVTFRVQGDFVVTSTAFRAFNLRGVGADGGTGGVTAGGAIVAGTDGKQFILRVGATNNQFGVGATTTVGIPASSPIDTIWQNYYSISTTTLVFNDSVVVLPGAGGGGGSSGNDAGTGTAGNGGAGGDGGGAFIGYIGGAYNVTGAINVSGTDGSAGTNATGSTVGSGAGGGGGAGGMFIALYNKLTADSGTYTVTGGAGGSGGANGNGGASGGTGGGGAASITTAGGSTSAAGGTDGTAGGAGRDGFTVRMFDYY